MKKPLLALAVAAAYPPTRKDIECGAAPVQIVLERGVLIIQPGCPFCGVPWGHYEDCTSPNAGTSVLPRILRPRFHEISAETDTCERCRKTRVQILEGEGPPTAYGMKECEPMLI